MGVARLFVMEYPVDKIIHQLRGMGNTYHEKRKPKYTFLVLHDPTKASLKVYFPKEMSPVTADLKTYKIDGNPVTSEYLVLFDYVIHEDGSFKTSKLKELPVNLKNIHIYVYDR